MCVYFLSDTLQNYKAAKLKHGETQQDLQEQLDSQKMPDMQAKYRERKEAQDQLKEIEDKVGMGTYQKGWAIGLDGFNLIMPIVKSSIVPEAV